MEEASQNPKGIALSIFRFRARRGIGVYYSLLSIIPFLSASLELLSLPYNFKLVAITILIAAVWFLGNLAGMTKFHQMARAIELFEGPKKSHNRLVSLLKSGVVSPILPWTAIIVFEIIGISVVALIVFIAWIIGLLANSIFAFSRRSSNNIVQRRIEDWLVIIFLPIFLLLSSFLAVTALISLIALSATFLGAGIKSLYEAPKELVQTMTSNEDKEAFVRLTQEFSPSEIASAGALSNSARIGIMVALLGVKRMTFTELMFTVKVSKSSLSRSIKILEEANYIVVQKGFLASGGPRTFIQLTEKGREAIHLHLKTMQRLTSKYLP